MNGIFWIRKDRSEDKQMRENDEISEEAYDKLEEFMSVYSTEMYEVEW